MDLSFSDEQMQLQQSVQRYLAQRYDFAQRQRIIASVGDVGADRWQDFAQFGWLALPFAQSLGGLGGSSVDLHLLAEAFGQALVVEPYLSSVVLCGTLIEAIGVPIHRDAMIGQIAAGQLQVALAHEEPAGRIAPMTQRALQTRASATSNGWQLSGVKSNVLGAPGAPTLIVSASLATAGTALQEERTALFLVHPGAPGVVVRAFELIDGQRAASLELDAVRVTPLDRLDDAQAPPTAGDAALAQAYQRAMIFAASQAVGSMQALLDATLAHVKTRHQFGQALSANQVIRHRLVDMAIACEEARAITLRAAIAFIDRDPDRTTAATQAIAAVAARIKVGRGARFVAEQAVQLHGAMGVTEELNIGAYFKSLLAFELRFGAGEQAEREQYLRLRERASRRADDESQRLPSQAST